MARNDPAPARTPPAARAAVPARSPGPRVVVRSLLFNAAFWTWTPLMAVALLPLLAAPRPALRAGVRLWLRGVQGALRALAGTGYEVRGMANVPDGPAIIAARHQSAWETLAFHLLIRDLAIALKKELMHVPVFGWYLRRAGMIGIDRAAGAQAVRALVRRAEAAAARGDHILIFPEGSRVPPGAQSRYLPGVAALYARLGRPVVPVALNSGLYWSRRGFIKWPGTIVVEFLPPIEPGLDRRAFMALLKERLEAGTARLLAEAGAPTPGPPAPSP